jgi:hypothetical protein
LVEALQLVDAANSAFAASPDAPAGDRLRWRALRIELLARLGRFEAAKEALTRDSPTTVAGLASALDRHGLAEEAAHLAAVSLSRD